MFAHRATLLVCCLHSQTLFILFICLSVCLSSCGVSLSGEQFHVKNDDLELVKSSLALINGDGTATRSTASSSSPLPPLPTTVIEILRKRRESAVDADLLAAKSKSELLDLLRNGCSSTEARCYCDRVIVHYKVCVCVHFCVTALMIGSVFFSLAGVADSELAVRQREPQGAVRVVAASTVVVGITYERKGIN